MGILQGRAALERESRMGIADVLTLKRPESLIFLANLGLGSGVEYAPFSHEGEGGNGHRLFP